MIVGNNVFAGGSFTTARPAGAHAPTGTVARSNLLSYNLTTSALTSWAPTLNGQVRALDVSPDGTRIYAVGQFTTVSDVARNRVVAFDTATGAAVSGFNASAHGQVFAVTTSASAVYVGGQFTAASGVQRPGGAAAASASNGLVLPWAPTLSGGRAFATEVAPDNSKVVVAGNFTTVNGSGYPGYGMGAVDTVGGASAPWALDLSSGSLVQMPPSTTSIPMPNRSLDRHIHSVEVATWRALSRRHGRGISNGSMTAAAILTPSQLLDPLCTWRVTPTTALVSTILLKRNRGRDNGESLLARQRRRRFRRAPSLRGRHRPRATPTVSSSRASSPRSTG